MTTETPTPQPGTAEYDAAMIAKVDGTPAPVATETPAEPERPEWLPAKFKTVEDMAKAYSELEKKQSGGKPSAAPAEADLSIAPVSKTTDDVAAEAAVAQAGLDFETLSAKVMQTGTLDDTDYAALEKSGIPRAMADAYVAGQQALAAQRAAEVYATVGGQETYAAVTEWAANNLPQAEIDAYNGVVDRGDLAATSLALAGLKARYDAANGSSPRLVSGSVAPTTSGTFQSTAEVTAAMSDKRYRTDPAYRAMVAEKLSRSNVL